MEADMASVWVSEAANTFKAHGGMSTVAAQATMESMAAAWMRRPGSRGISRISALEVHLIKNGAVYRHLYIEPCSPPSRPTGGDRYRKVGA